MTENKKIILTFDVEDWFQVENLRPWMPPSSWDNLESRVERNTQKILNILDNAASETSSKHLPKATFFLLGWIVKRMPSLAREIDSRGHEVASHGFHHQLCSTLTENELKSDLINSKNLIEDIIGKPVWGYRAPSFSISTTTLRHVHACGYYYDSSYNSFDMHGRYGKLDTSNFTENESTFQIKEDFFEIPLSNLTVFRKILPWAGGGYFRLIPFSLFRIGVKNILEKNNSYVFYAHPWEFDPEQPVLSQASFMSRLKHYNNLSKTSNRLTSFLSYFSHCRFLTCHEYLGHIWRKNEK